MLENSAELFLSEKEKNAFIEALTQELSSLRAKAGISQEELSNLIGVSRQTYGAVERRTRKMSWDTYLSLIFFYDNNKRTHSLLRGTLAFPTELIRRFNGGDAPTEVDLTHLFTEDTRVLLEALDEQALNTLRTVLMVEYSRCKEVPPEAVIKFFNGIDLIKKPRTESEKRTSRALKNIRRNRAYDE